MIPLWLNWYFILVPRAISRGWSNILGFAFRRYFAVPSMVKSLAAPWRGIQWAYPRGFDLGRLLEALFSNLVSRLIGALVRLLIVVLALAVESAIFVVGLASLLSWFSLFWLTLAALLGFYPSLAIIAALLVLSGQGKQFTAWQRQNPSATPGGPLDSLDFKTRQILAGVPPSADNFFLACLKPEKGFVPFLFQRLLLDSRILAKSLTPTKQSEDVAPLLADAGQIAAKWGQSRTGLTALLVSLAKSSPFFHETLVQSDLKPEDVENLAWWWQTIENARRERGRFWEEKNLARLGAFAPDLAAGFTATLDQFSRDVTFGLFDKNFEQIIGHQEQIEQLERFLAKSEFNNVLLVGEPGSGRGAIVQALAQKIFFGESLAELNHFHVKELDWPRLLNFKSAVLETVLAEAANAGNIILVLPDFHNVVAGSGNQNKTDFSDVFLKYLRQPGFRIVGVTDYEGLHRFIETSQVKNFFEKVEVSPVSAQDTVKLLELMTPVWEAKYRKFLSYPALKELVYKADKYLPAAAFPKKATDLMAELWVFASQAKENVILVEHVDRLLSSKTQIPIGQLSLQEKNTLLNLEDILHQRIIGQEEAVKEVASALRRARADITIRKGPMGAFLFLGPTGVGKTETAKALAAVYFGAEERMIRLDLSEYQNPTDLKRLLGSDEEPSFFVNAVRENPFSLVLLDEIEKAHPNLLNLFLQVLDEGSMRDGLGRPVSFNHTIIIATSNAGYQIILDAIQQNLEMAAIKEKLLNYIFTQGVFRPEFVNRFDAVVVFRGLTPDNLIKIADLMLQKLKKNLAEKGAELVVSDELKSEIARLGFDPVFGARQMRRVVQDKVENAIASGLLSGQIQRGSKIEITVPDFQLKVTG